jgi:acetylglutamate kinase
VAALQDELAALAARLNETEASGAAAVVAAAAANTAEVSALQDELTALRRDMASKDATIAELQAAKLIYVTDVPGIMRDASDRDSLIPSVTTKQVKSLIQQKIIAGGMIPKVLSAISAMERGVGKIHMIGGHIQHCLLLEIFTNAGIGTEIVPD